MSGQKYREANPRTKAGSESRLKEALNSRVTWVSSIFLLGYVGAEVALGGWIVTFMRRERGGGDFESGIVATGFWTGITVGRLVLGFIMRRLGEKFAVLVCILTQSKRHYTDFGTDLHRSRHGLPAYVLAGTLFPRLCDLCCSSRLLPRSSLPRHCGCCYQGFTCVPPRFRDRLCSCFWWWWRSSPTFRNRFTCAGQGRCCLATDYSRCSRCLIDTLVLLS